MAFTKPTVGAAHTVAAPNPSTTSAPDIWAIFRALRDVRDLFGLRPGHIQTLQAMISFLKPGQGETVFASNRSICQRVGGVDERTLRRHVSRLVELGFARRDDSSNRKRYRVRSSGGECISYGVSLAPLFKRADELVALGQEMENSRRDRIFLRKQILARLGHLEAADPDDTFVPEARKALRRKLSVAEHRALLDRAIAQCAHLSTAVDTPEVTKLPAKDGQTDRHQSKSKQENKDTEQGMEDNTPDPRMLTAVCEQATAFATRPLGNWLDIEDHARTLAPMMGIHQNTFDMARTALGGRKTSCAIFIMLQMGNRIRNFGAYFHSITLGPRRHRFDPIALLRRLSNVDRCGA